MRDAARPVRGAGRTIKDWPDRDDPSSQTPLRGRKSLLELICDHLGLVVFAIARAVDKGDWAQACLGGQVIKRLRLLRFPELRVITRPKLWPARRVVAEPLAELRARAEVSCPRVEPQSLLRSPSRPDAVD